MFLITFDIPLQCDLYTLELFTLHYCRAEVLHAVRFPDVPRPHQHLPHAVCRLRQIRPRHRSDGLGKAVCPVVYLKSTFHIICVLIYNKVLVNDGITWGRISGDYFPLTDFILLHLTYSLSSLICFEFCQINQRVYDHFALRCSGIIGRFPDGFPVAMVPIEYVLHVQEVSEAPVKAVHLRDEDYIDIASFDQIEHLLELVSVVLGARDSIIHKLAYALIAILTYILT